MTAVEHFCNNNSVLFSTEYKTKSYIYTYILPWEDQHMCQKALSQPKSLQMAEPGAPSLQPPIFTAACGGDYRKDGIFVSPFQFAWFWGFK